jgi:phosphoribosyl-ATP pyrophosphohydrolase/phosphoribosyl-AMP cyclohydrolase
MIDPDDVRWDDRGLVPVLVQDAATGRMLMLAYQNREALAATASRGEAHFWSRSRHELWRKGATSGNTMTVAAITPDCDGDALLLSVYPSGPACHRGSVSCFDGGSAPETTLGNAVDSLTAVVASRAMQRPEGSYTVRLLEGGADLTARKVLEEAGEVAFAAKDHAAGTGSAKTVSEEAADLLYHLVVLLAERGVSPGEVAGVLAERAASSQSPG